MGQIEFPTSANNQLDSLTSFKKIDFLDCDSALNNISDSCTRNELYKNTLNKLQFRPSGSIAISATVNNDFYQPYPTVFSLDGHLSQSLLSVPLSISAGINHFGYSGNKMLSTFEVSFDRHLFLDQLKKMLLQKQQEKYQNLFDSVRTITTKLNSFDSIRNLLNDKELLAAVTAAYTLTDSSLCMNTDSVVASFQDKKFTTTTVADANRIIEQYTEIQHYYNELLVYQKEILAKFQTRDISKITNQLALPISPDHLNEAQLLNAAKEYGMNQTDQLLSGLKQFTVGQIALNQSPLTIQNKVASGLSISYALRNIYFGTTLAREKMNTAIYARSSGIFDQFNLSKQFNVITQALLGTGSPDKEFMELSVTQFNFKDDPDQIDSVMITPFKNTLVSLSAGAVNYKGFRGSAEVSVAANSYFPSNIVTESPAESRPSQHFGYHFQIERQVLKTGSSFNLEYLSAGPLYKTYGNNYLVSDSRSVKGIFSQSAFRNKLIISGRFYWIQHNVSSYFQLPFFQLNYSGEVKYQIHNGSLVFRYNPVISSSPLSDQINKLELIQFQFSRNYELFRFPVSTLISIYSTHMPDGISEDTLKDSGSAMLRADFQQRFSFTPKFSINALASVQSVSADLTAPTYYLVDVNGIWQLGKRGLLSGNFSLNKFAASKYVRGGITAGCKVFKKGMVNIHADISINAMTMHDWHTGMYHGSISYSQNF